jgi:hypothetical protein
MITGSPLILLDVPPTTINTLISAAVALLIGATVILLGLALRALVEAVMARLRQSSTSGESPTLTALFDALMPFIYQAILAGEKIALWSMDQTDAVLTGLDKAQIANSLYALLPDMLMINGVPLPIGRIKALVPRDLFALWVKEAYDSAHGFILRNEAYLREQVELETKDKQG